MKNRQESMSLSHCMVTKQDLSLAIFLFPHKAVFAGTRRLTPNTFVTVVSGQNPKRSSFGMSWHAVRHGEDSCLASLVRHLPGVAHIGQSFKPRLSQTV